MTADAIVFVNFYCGIYSIVIWLKRNTMFPNVSALKMSTLYIYMSIV